VPLPLGPFLAAVALFVNDVRAVPAALMLARAAGSTIWQNIAFAVLTKVCRGLHGSMFRFVSTYV